MDAVKLEFATAQMMPIVLNMANLYRYDLSEFTHWSIEDDGMHRCYGLEIYWSHKNLPFIIYVNDELAGFVLIETKIDKHQTQYDIGEFFILRKFRRFGLATIVASELFQRYKGQWTIQQLIQNIPAIKFWEKTLSNYTQNNFETSSMLDKEVGEMCVMKFSN